MRCARSCGPPGRGWFPIPMRGNETPQGGALLRQFGRFPIPMRGNETTLQPIASWALSFPIPMRGNETCRTFLAKGSTPVPDPHEG